MFKIGVNIVYVALVKYQTIECIIEMMECQKLISIIVSLGPKEAPPKLFWCCENDLTV